LQIELNTTHQPRRTLYQSYRGISEGPVNSLNYEFFLSTRGKVGPGRSGEDGVFAVWPPLEDQEIRRTKICLVGNRNAVFGAYSSVSKAAGCVLHCMTAKK
jgi:hypothetical protein